MSIKKYAVYDSSGSITQTMTCAPRVALLQDFEPCFIVEVPNEVDDATHWISDDAPILQLKLMLITTNTPLTANGTDETVISGIPEGVQVRWPDGQTDMVNDGEIRFSVDLPGTYTFRFTAVPYLDKEVTIEAIAAT